jgi:hypothetical protein
MNTCLFRGFQGSAWALHKLCKQHPEQIARHQALTSLPAPGLCNAA